MTASDLPASPAALRAAIPRGCFEPDLARSARYLAVDLAALAALVALSTTSDRVWLLVPIWFLQGTLFWSLFVIGHDCGHGSFSGQPRLDAVVGHLLHTPLLVPFHAWRISHRKHHQHAGDVERDEGWFPLTAEQWRALPVTVRVLRSWLLLLVFPLYLLRGTPQRAGSHFDPEAQMFPPHERGRVRTSVRLCQAMAALLVLLALAAGPWLVVKHWLVPYLVFCGWLDLVTFLHHTDARLPWYRDSAWTWLRGALSTVDRRYGIFEKVHHDAGCHVAHHLFPTLPHYHLREAAAAIRPLLGTHYREARTGILRSLLDALRECRVVPAEGDVVYYARVSPAERPAPSGAGARPMTT